MLILSRKKDEEVLITTPEGRTITLKIVDIRRGVCRLGVTADSTVVIARTELINKKAPSDGLERPTT